LISFGQFEADFIKEIAESVSREFPYPVLNLEGHMDLSSFFDPNRRQYDGNLLLKMVDTKYGAHSSKTFGLFNVDLFIPILTFIFGQAYLGGRTGIASVYRLSNERYGMKDTPRILLERSIKEVNHELGHTFGMIHCHTPGCVMASSTYVEDIDQKDAGFCHHCQTLLKSG
jgi:archaemetzincin